VKLPGVAGDDGGAPLGAGGKGWDGRWKRGGHRVLRDAEPLQQGGRHAAGPREHEGIGASGGRHVSVCPTPVFRGLRPGGGGCAGREELWEHVGDLRGEHPAVGPAVRLRPGFPANACRSTPAHAASNGGNAHAIAPMMPPSTSPEPAVPRAGHDTGDTAIRASGDATIVCAPFSTTTAPVAATSSRAARKRSASTAAGVFPRRRAASPGCGVRMAFFAAMKTPGLPANIVSASASTTIGPCHDARTYSTAMRASSPRPKPGPMTTACGLCARSVSRLSPVFFGSRRAVITSSTLPSMAVAASGQVASVVRPAPARMAPCATSCGAPILPGEPPITTTWPAELLYAPGARGTSQCPRSALSRSCAEPPTCATRVPGTPMSTTNTRPRARRPPA